MEEITVDKKRLSQLIYLAPVVVSLNNRIYRRCTIDCNRCKFYDKGCYSFVNEFRVVPESYREEVILKWLKGD